MGSNTVDISNNAAGITNNAGAISNNDADILSISNDVATNTYEIQQLGDVCPSSSDPNYRSFGSKCYYFESSPATYNDAQTACNSKIGTGGKLAEPSASVELYAFLYLTASSIVNNSGPYWIGIDDLQNNDGVFRYASTLSVASVPSGFSGSLDNTPSTDDCAAVFSATKVEDVPCSNYYASICESVGLTNDAHNVVWFEAWSSGVQTVSGGPETITYGGLEGSVGSGMTAATGIFTAPMDGVFEFHIQAYKWETGNKGIRIVKDGQVISHARDDDDALTTLFASAITELVTGDQVWAITEGSTFGHSFRYTKFIGKKI